MLILAGFDRILFMAQRKFDQSRCGPLDPISVRFNGKPNAEAAEVDLDWTTCDIIVVADGSDPTLNNGYIDFTDAFWNAPCNKPTEALRSFMADLREVAQHGRAVFVGLAYFNAFLVQGGRLPTDDYELPVYDHLGLTPSPSST
ncbi:hypothetical protein Q5752_000067 [Cryptotrichosporon argae]